MEPPRMWWLQVEGIRHWILAVEWSSSICNSNVNVPKEEVFDSSHHPWPAEFRAPIRSLRSLDRKLHGMSWYVDAANGIIAIGCGDNKKQKYQALKYAWILCRSWRTENNPARHAPTIRVDPQDPDDHDGQETWAVNAEYAVVLHKYDNTTSVTRAWVTGYFFSTRETARAYFEKVKYGEWAATFLGADGKQLDRWHQCYINNGPNKLEQAAREWYRQAKQQAKMAGRGPSQSVLSPQPPRDTAAPEDIKAEADNRGVTSQPPRSKADPNNIKLEADNEGVAMVEAIRAFFNGEEDTVENVFERMRRMVQIEQTIKQEASTIRVPVTARKESEAQKELGAALKTYEQLKPQCADAGASYEERKAKRDAEIKSLEQVEGPDGGWELASMRAKEMKEEQVQFAEFSQFCELTLAEKAGTAPGHVADS
eukprot:Skav220732  [mRNA]  locus=scaffold2753:244342:251589:- [translate_table: standard]